MADQYTPRCTHHELDTTAFVLGELGGERRAAMVAHLQHCTLCQMEVASLTDTLADLTGLIPPIAPTPGFVARTLDALPVEPPGVLSVTATPTTRLVRRIGTTVRTRKAWAMTAAAALVTAMLGIGLAAHSFSGHQSPPSPAIVAEMHTVTGTGVGQAVVFEQRPALVTVALDFPPGTAWTPGGPYKVLAVRRNGQAVSLGSLEVVAGEGGLQVRTPISAADIAVVRVVSANGQDLCTGLIPAAPPSNTDRTSGLLVTSRSEPLTQT